MVYERAREARSISTWALQGPGEIEVLEKTTPWMAEHRRFDRMSKDIVKE
jgi:hypothetical protein